MQQSPSGSTPITSPNSSPPTAPSATVNEVPSPSTAAAAGNPNTAPVLPPLPPPAPPQAPPATPDPAPQKRARRGRPKQAPGASKSLPAIPVRLPRELLARLDRVSAATPDRVSRSALIRRLVAEGLPALEHASAAQATAGAATA